MNKLDELFCRKKKNILNIYCTAGYPAINSLQTILPALQQQGADIIEVGIPYSDPIADGPVIQQSNMQALQNGMTIPLLLQQLNSLKNSIHIPIILMGYLNPVLQYGIEKFCKDAKKAGVSGIILPDLPMYEYEQWYQPYFAKNNLHPIFLISPQTSMQRIKYADKLSSGFVYAVSSSSTTGSNKIDTGQQQYFKKLKSLKLKNPLLIGFGIKDKVTFQNACKYTAGAIIGSAYIKAIENSKNIQSTTAQFIKSVKQ